MTGEQILIDSDAFIGLIFRQDAHHATMARLWRRLQEEHHQLLTTNLVIAETATMLSRRVSLKHAQQFLVQVTPIKTIYIDTHLHRLAVKLFNQQSRAHTSLVDMSNVVVVRELGLSRILGFDAVYSKDFGLPLAA